MSKANAGKIYIICGTTAGGKTKFAIEMAPSLNAEVINADSMQVYQEIPVLTAQPTKEEMQGVPHHLYGIVSCLPSAQQVNVASWVELAKSKIDEIRARGKTPILVGGTGMYIKGLVYGLAYVPPIPEEIKDQVRDIEDIYKALQSMDPQVAERLKPNDKQRIARALEVIMATGKSLAAWQQEKHQYAFPREEYHIMLLSRPREQIYKNIDKRFLEMIENGALEEARSLAPFAFKKVGDDEEFVLPKAHGLSELINYLNGDMTLEEAIAKSQQNSRNYAKRQITWFEHQIDFDENVIL